jgi:hypothetical protein
MQDFPANSTKAKTRSSPPEDRPEKIEQVTSAEAKQRKRRLGSRFRETFFGGDARTTLEYMTMEVVVPGIRDMMFDAFESGLRRMIYGEGSVKRGMLSSYSDRGRVDYASISKTQGSRSLSQRSRARHDFGEIVIQNRQEAEDVLDRMYEELSRFGYVTVSVLYELTGIRSSHTDQKWGWTSLRGAKVSRMRSGGFLLDLPTPEPLDR